jgi:hypothetical protein
MIVKEVTLEAKKLNNYIQLTCNKVKKGLEKIKIPKPKQHIGKEQTSC